MKELNELELERINGGTVSTLTSATINAIVNVIKVIEEAGYKVGSSFRRIGEGNLCPLDKS